MEAPPNRKSKTLQELLIASPLPSLIGSLPDPIGTQCIVREGKSHPGPSYGIRWRASACGAPYRAPAPSLRAGRLCSATARSQNRLRRRNPESAPRPRPAHMMHTQKGVPALRSRASRMAPSRPPPPTETLCVCTSRLEPPIREQCHHHSIETVIENANQREFSWMNVWRIGQADEYMARFRRKASRSLWGPSSGPEADDWVRDRKLARPDWTFTIDSLRTPIGCATRREQTRETYRKNSAAAIIEAGSRSWEKRWPGERR